MVASLVIAQSPVSRISWEDIKKIHVQERADMLTAQKLALENCGQVQKAEIEAMSKEDSTLPEDILKLSNEHGKERKELAKIHADERQALTKTHSDERMRFAGKFH